MGRLADRASAAKDRRAQAEDTWLGQDSDNAAQEPEPQREPQTETDTEPQSEPPKKPENMGDQEPILGEPDPMYYKPPGYVTDIEDRRSLLAKWSRLVDQVVETAVLSTKADERSKGKPVQFYNAARESDTPVRPATVKWLAFPKNLDGTANKWEEADKRENQDEYCEWEVKRNAAGELVSVTFTTEVPEYYTFLASVDEKGDRLLDVYNNDLNPDQKVERKDLFAENGDYNMQNGWNIRSRPDDAVHEGAIAHLLRANNNLRELVGLVVDATVVVPHPTKPGEFLTKYDQRLPYIPQVSKQSARRHSDPRVANFISTKVAEGKRVTVINPLGPYIETLELDKLHFGAGRKVSSQMWRTTRGNEGHPVRAVFTVPSELVGKLQDKRGTKIKYGSQIAQYLWVSARVGIANQPAPGTKVAPPPILSYIEGRQIKPTPLSATFVHDQIRGEPFGKYLLKRQHHEQAVTLGQLLAHQPDYTWVAFAADEGIGHELATSRKDVRVRVVVVCTPDHPTKPQENGSRMARPEQMLQNAFRRPTFAIVAVAPRADPNNIHSDGSILQVASFDPDKGWFNFYDRERLKSGPAPGQWLYFGCSKDAFTPDTQGLGPFCGHANGGLIMKEFEDPWPHWHTSENPLTLPNHHPMMQDPLFRDPDTDWYFAEADHLARMVAAATKAWFSTRRFLDFGPIRNPHQVAQRVHQWMAHVCLTTTVSLTCSIGNEEEFTIPSGFFFDSSALALVLDDIQSLEEGIKCSVDLYSQAREELGILTLSSLEKDKGQFKVASESEGFAPWKVIIPSNEDVEGIRGLMEAGLLPKRVLLALLMIDFWNPVFSYRRARLMRYMPSEAQYIPAAASTDDRYGFGKDLIQAIEYAKISLELDDASPEVEFLDLMKLPNLEEEARKTLSTFIQQANVRLATKDGVLGYLRVSETKRRLFRPPPATRRSLHPLAEFDMSVPYATKMGDGEVWLMQKDASVVKEQDPSGSTWHPRNSQAHFSSAGCPFSASF